MKDYQGQDEKEERDRESIRRGTAKQIRKNEVRQGRRGDREGERI
jgi:hypothetical protein